MMNKKIVENFPYQGVIIQNFFRFGGSYLYNSFIESNKTLGFYEPFHESLSNKKDYDFLKENFEKFKINQRHPNKEFYFSNFPIDSDWFIKFHKKNMPTMSFMLDRKDSKECKIYLSNLIEYSLSKKLIPVFKINRMYLNPEILNFSKIYNIFIIRDPVTSFWSNVFLNRLEPYYSSINVHSKNKINPFDKIVKIIESKKLEPIKMLKNKINFQNKSQMDLHFSIFFLIWIYGFYKNLKHDFLFINYNQLYEKKYSNNISDKIFKKTGIKINFNDFKINSFPIYNTIPNIDEEILAIIKETINYEELKMILSEKNLTSVSKYLPK